MSTHGDGGKGSDRRPGQGYQDGWDRIFGKKTLEEQVFEDQVKPVQEELDRKMIEGDKDSG